MAEVARIYEQEPVRKAKITEFPVQEQPKREGNKKRGTKSEVYAYEPEDLKKMLSYFQAKGSWTNYLALVLSCNMARRCGDTLSLRWKNFFLANGNFRTDILEIREDKTDKLANPHINSAVREAINLYIEKTGANPAYDNYEGYVFEQLSGTHAGKVISEDGHLKALKKAAEECGIKYNIGTHSGRKFFGMMNRRLHPNDYDSMQILQSIYNHSSEKITSNYIGLTREKANKYYDDMGNFFGDYVTGDKEYVVEKNRPVTTLDSNDLRNLLQMAYEQGMQNAGETRPSIHMDALNDLIKMVEEMQK